MKLLYIHNRCLDHETADIIQVLSMCQAFSQLGIETILFVPERKNKDKNIYKYVNEEFGIENEFKIVESIFPTKIGKFFSIKYLKNIYLKEHPDICYCRDINIINKCVKLNFPVIYENHNKITHLGYLVIDKIFKYKFKKLSNKSNFLKLITINNRLKRYWVISGIPRSKVDSFHDGFIAKNYQYEISRVRARGRIGIKGDKKNVVYTGNLRYGVDKLLIKLASKFRDVNFHIVGGPLSISSSLKKEVENAKLSNVQVIGSIPHNKIPLYHYSADVLLAIWTQDVPHIESISPLKLFEYMASGRIIVAHSYPTIKEVLSDGYNCLLATPNSDSELSKKLTLALKMDYPNSIASQAKSDAFEKYSWKKRAKKIIDTI